MVLGPQIHKVNGATIGQKHKNGFKIVEIWDNLSQSLENRVGEIAEHERHARPGEERAARRPVLDPLCETRQREGFLFRFSQC